MADVINQAPYFLFQNYIVEIVKYFRTVKSFVIDDTAQFTQANGNAPIPNPNYGLPLPLYTTFGNPRAAFQKMIERFNGLTRLPYLNINLVDHIRRVEKEPVGVRYWVRESIQPGDTKTTVHSPPMQFDVTYKCTLITSSAQEMNHIMYTIYTMFPRNEISLILKDPSNKGFVFIPLKIDYTVTDATQWESTNNKDEREFIRTEFTIQAQHTVPLPHKEVPIITNVQFDINGSGYPSGGILSYNEHIRYNLSQKSDGTVIVTL